MADPLYEDKHNTLNTQPAITGNMVASDGEIYNIVDLLLGGGGGITVDSALSLTSENPVQNKVITSTLSELSASTNIDNYLDMIIAGNTSDLPIIVQSTYSEDLDDIIGGTYDNNV